MVLTNFSDLLATQAPSTNMTLWSLGPSDTLDAEAGQGGAVANATNDTLAGPGGAFCNHWIDAQHALFQLANLFTVTSFMTPSTFRYHMFFLRLMLNFGYVFTIVWSTLFICMADVLAWNVVFLVVNSAHLAYLGYHIVPARFLHTMDDLYGGVFKPLRVTRAQFRELSNFSNIALLAKGTAYATEGTSQCGQKLSVLLKGRLKVTYEGLYLHSIEANQFVDSPEYDAATNFHGDATFQVTISATEDCLLVSWPHRRLRTFLQSDAVFAHIFHQLVGKDVSQKLYQIQERLMSNPCYMESLISRQSSMVNIRHSIVSSSTSNLTKLNCLQGCMVQAEYKSNPSSMGTYETSV